MRNVIERAATGTHAAQLVKRARILLVIFTIGLIASGITAFPLQWELDILKRLLVDDPSSVARLIPGLPDWIALVHRGLTETYRNYPFMAYGTDWLAFAHLAIAVAFWGPIRAPVKNVWVIEFGMIACAMLIPFTLIFGPLREIPFGWQLIDCSFGVVGIVPLWLARNAVQRAMRLETVATA
jgi:hypothetical protein